jgi:hypothetical protein
MKKGLNLLLGLLILVGNAFAQDKNFHIYLCFGQSNMEGQGTIEAQDRVQNSRFKVLEAVDCSNLGRKKGTWYTAVPPLCRCWSGLSPSDYFGRILVENLPAEIKVGVVNVSVAGCKIELFQKENYQSYYASITEDWLKNIISEYGGNPYARLVEMAKLAQKDGVIRGILLHQGESNTGDNAWPSKVKSVYDNLIKDLGLHADSVPLLAGEVVHADQGGVCASMNSIIAKLPQSIPNAHVISSKGCADASDNLHFSSVGYRELGKRYALKMLSLMGVEIKDPDKPAPPVTESLWFEAERYIPDTGSKYKIVVNESASDGKYLTVPAGVQAIATEPFDSSGYITIPFSVSQDTLYHVYGRINCPTYNDDSFWMKMDQGMYTMCGELKTSGWEWKKIKSYQLRKGRHTLSIGYREDGANLDKIGISSKDEIPAGMGGVDSVKLTNISIDLTRAYRFRQNVPNPFSSKTCFIFDVPVDTQVSLKVFTLSGIELVELAGNEFKKGNHRIEFDATGFAPGVYLVAMKAGPFYGKRKMMVTLN